MSVGAWRGVLLAARLSVCAVLSSLACSPTAQAQGEGPRAYELAPEGSQLLSLYGMFSRGNASFDPGAVAPGVDADVNGAIIEYSHAFALHGRLVTLIATLPGGVANASVNTASAARSYTRSGVGDLQLTAVFGLIGSPALQEKEYEQYQPRFALSALTRVYAPTGAYDRTAPVNPGQNRWALQLGVPLSYYIGHSFLDPALTSFELQPSVTWYGDNDEPPQGNHSSKAPLLQLEAHVTRNINPSLWVSVDALFMDGAETTIDGVSQNDRQRSLALGATVSVALNDAVSATLSYTDAVNRNYDGVSGHVIRIVAEFSL
jgi:hypothetical protein